MKIDFVLPMTNLRNPRAPHLDPAGMSGTDQPCYGNAYELRKLGHQVRIWGPWTGTFRPDFDYPALECAAVRQADAVVAWHDGRDLPSWDAPVKIAHHQTYGLVDPHMGLGVEEADLYFSATERNARFLAERWGGPRWAVLPNACDLEGDERPPWDPVPGRLIFHADPMRGLAGLLKVLPQLIEAKPETHVHVYNFGMERLTCDQPTEASQERATAILEGIERHKGRVVLSGSVSRHKMLQALSRAACYAYPCSPPTPCEVYPMSIADACASGVPVVLWPDDGIEEVFRGGVDLVDSEAGFVERTTAMLTDTFQDEVMAASDRGRDWSTQWSYRDTAQALLRAIEAVKGEKDAG